MLSSSTHRHLLDYKVTKIIRLIRKIKSTLQEEGLDQKQLPRIIHQSLDFTLNQQPNDQCLSSAFQQFAVHSLTQNSNKFTVSTLLALSQTYQELLSKLDDRSYFYELNKIPSSKQTAVKIEQGISSIQEKKERSGVVKIQQGVGAQNTFSSEQKAIRKLKKELIKKKKQMKILEAEYQYRINPEAKVEPVEKKKSKKDKKSKRK